MLGYLLYRFGEMVAALLGRQGSYWLACCIADIRFARSRRTRAVIEKNLAVALQETGGSSVRARARDAFRNFAKSIADFLRIHRVNKHFIHSHVQIQGLEHLRAALKAGQGALLVSSHLGNWEMGAAVLSRLGFKVHAMALPHADSRVNDYFDRQRRSTGAEVISTRFGVRRCLELLRRNKIVAILGDKDFTGRPGVHVRFLGRRTEFPRGPAAMAVKTGAAFIPIFVTRDGRDNYEVMIKSPLNASVEEKPDQKVITLTQKFAHIFEGILRVRTAQWTLFRPMWSEELLAENMAAEAVVR